MSTNKDFQKLRFDVLSSITAGLDLATLDDGDLAHAWAWLVEARNDARRQLTDTRSRAGQPVVVDAMNFEAVMSGQGHPMTPLITSDRVGTADLSTAEVRMQPRRAARAHVHLHTGVAVVLLVGQAVTVWWDDDGTMHEIMQLPFQHLYIPAGVPHAALNPFSQPLVAAVARANVDCLADNELLPNLDADIAARMSALAAA